MDRVETVEYPLQCTRDRSAWRSLVSESVTSDPQKWGRTNCSLALVGPRQGYTNIVANIGMRQ